MEKIIWTFWWQGEKNAPILVKKCINSMRIHSNNAKVIVVDKDNISQYITLPTHVEKLIINKKISITHLSDYVRFNLLFKYGGLWLDSTVFVANDISDSIFISSFFTVKPIKRIDYKNIAQDRWTSFIIGGNANNIVFGRVLDLMNLYWEKYDEIVCYFFIDFCLNEVYRQSAEVRKEVDAVEYYYEDVFELMNSITSVFDINENIENKGLFHKLNRKAFEEKNKKIRSFERHLKYLFDYSNVRKWGIKIVFWTFLNDCTRSSKRKISFAISEKYNQIIQEFWHKVSA